ncbi:MAG TPA: glycoside hydrolase family 130 protein [Candidatus Limnocylindria bacterium]|nr:glycoside hydrolase family 130 protein [Candidatus Limnocylindria bacterium]
MKVAARADLGRRLAENPLLVARDVPASQDALEVVSVFNAATAVIEDEVILLLRVAERPRTDLALPPGALTLDLSGPHPVQRPLPHQYTKDDVIGMAYMDASTQPPSVRVAYIPKDLPGLDLRDPRAIRYKNGTGPLHLVNEGYQDYLAQISHLRVARSRDGIHFTVEKDVALGPLAALEEYGVEDPRITWIDGTFHVTYVSVSRWGITTSLATTSDFVSFDRKGVILLPDHKDVVIFPEKIRGKYVALTRPMPQSFAKIFGIWIAFSDDLKEWGGHQPLAMPRWGSWDELRTGASAVPFRTERGWLELYHGVDRDTTYAIGALLMDLDDPRTVIARSPTPILRPTEVYETTGLFNDTVFSCGHIPLDERSDRIRVYYGAADSVVAAADLDVREILDSLEPC